MTGTLSPLHRLVAPTLLVLMLCAGLPVRAASISGRITSSVGTGLPAEVMLWAPGLKGWEVTQTLNANSNGDYVFNNLSPNTYRVFSRPSSSMASNYANRWYDVAPPNSSGWLMADADDLVIVNSSTNLTGINITLPLNGGIDGHVRTSAGTPLAGMYVRAEWPSDYRYHHNDVTKGSPQSGNFFMRGMVAETYTFLVYDPNANYRTAIFPGPFTVTSNNVATGGNLTLSAMPADPNEPNNTRTAGGSLIDATGLRAIPPQPWSSTGAAISPRNGDIDWYCLDAVAGDRFRLSTSTTITVNGVSRDHPWIDPVIGWFTSSGTLLAWADDQPQSFNPSLEVWVTSTGRYCAAVTMYGDTGWNGTGQGSAGRYQLQIEMLNRRPVLEVSYGGAPAPHAPESIVQAEGAELTLDLAFSDPDQDVLTVTATAVDAVGAPMGEGVLTLDAAAGTGTWEWSISHTAGDGSPYEVTFTVSDAEHDVTHTVAIEISSVNVPPTTPVPVSPADGATITTSTTELLVDNAVDADGDPIEIQFQVFYDQTLGSPAQSHQMPQGAMQTGWTPDPMPENAVVYWRVRAYDGQPVASYSLWSAWQHFRIDQQNDPPPAPEIFKPAPGQLSISRRPTLTLANVKDPDGDAVSYVFQLASDDTFKTVLAESGDVSPSGAPVTAWRVDQDLQWEATYYARAAAKDERGADSGFGASTPVEIKANVLPAEPQLLEPDPLTCGELVYTEAAPEEVVVAMVIDPEGEPVELQLEVVDAATEQDDDAVPYATGSAPQVAGLDATQVSFDGSDIPEDVALAYRVRAHDGFGATHWTTCPFWLNLDNATPGPSTIAMPESGSSVPLAGTGVAVEVELGVDPEVAAGIPGAWVTLAYCFTQGDAASCPPEPADWSRLDPSEITNNRGRPVVEPVEAGQRWTVSVCTLDERLACGPVTEATFVVAEHGGSVSGGCDCSQSAPTSGWGLLGLAGLAWWRASLRRRKVLS